MNESGFKDFNISDEIKQALNLLGYTKPTEVQNNVIPLVLDHKDIIVRSQTGSGKTASYGIPICEQIDWIENKPQVLVITPTRELAVQVKEDITNIGRFKRIKATAVYGRQPISIQKTELKQKNHVVVGTPGRLMDHIKQGTLVLSQIRYLIIDEADKLLNMGFVEQVEAIIDKITSQHVTLLFSATFPNEIKKLSTKYMNSPIEVEIEGDGIASNNIEHLLYEIKDNDKFSLLNNVTTINNPDSCIIFLRTKEGVDLVTKRLLDLDYNCDKIHGGMEQKDRLNAMNDFKRGKYQYLIATDVAARGIDIENVSLVINYDIPFDKENYVHRTGRTGRAGQKGKAITFVTTQERRYLKEIEEYIGFSIPVLEPPTTEEVLKMKPAFEMKMNAVPKIKKLKSDQLDKQIIKLRFNVGKQKKFRAANFVGMISNIEGVSEEDIGIITIMDTMTYIEILNGKGKLVRDRLNETTVMGKNIKIKEIVNK